MSSFIEVFKNAEARKVFQFPEFNRLLSARILITLVIQIQNISLYWMIYQLTKDPLSLGLIGLAEAIPSLAVVLYAGHLADIYDRKKIVIYSFLLFSLSSLALFFLSLYQGLSTDSFKIAVYSIVFISGIARGFYRPANGALLAQILPRSLYASGAAWSSSFWQIASVFGASLGGILIGFIGMKFTFLFAFSLAVLGLIALIGIKPKPSAIQQKADNLYYSLMMGVNFVFKNRIILGAMSLDLISVLFGGAVALLSVFASDVLKVGPELFGVLNAAPSVGAILMSLFLAFRPPLANAGRNLIFAVIGFGFSMIFFALSTNFWLSVFFLVLSGVFDSVSVVIRSAIMQLLTPDEMRGRVSAVNTMFIGSSNEIGAFESGLAARVMGLVPSVVFGGSMAVITGITTFFANKKLKNLNLNKYFSE